MQCNRFIILLEAYNASKTDTNKVVELREVCANSDVKNGNFKSAFDFLMQENLLTPNQTGSDSHACISHQGVKIVEYVITHGNERTELFPPFKDMGI